MVNMRASIQLTVLIVTCVNIVFTWIHISCHCVHAREQCCSLAECDRLPNNHPLQHGDQVSLDRSCRHKQL